VVSRLRALKKRYCVPCTVRFARACRACHPRDGCSLCVLRIDYDVVRPVGSEAGTALGPMSRISAQWWEEEPGNCAQWQFRPASLGRRWMVSDTVRDTSGPREEVGVERHPDGVPWPQNCISETPCERFVRSQLQSFQSLGVALPLDDSCQLHLLSRDETLTLRGSGASFAGGLPLLFPRPSLRPEATKIQIELAIRT
jgi:hypothetical protein